MRLGLAGAEGAGVAGARQVLAAEIDAAAADEGGRRAGAGGGGGDGAGESQGGGEGEEGEEGEEGGGVHCCGLWFVRWWFVRWMSRFVGGCFE